MSAGRTRGEDSTPGLAGALNRQRLVQYFFFAVFLFLLWQLLRILSPFYVALLGSALLSVLIHPVHAGLLRRLPGSPNAAALLTTGLVVSVVVVPVVLFGWVFLKEAGRIYPAVQAWVRESGLAEGRPHLADLPPRLADLFGRAQAFLGFWNIDLQDILLKNLDELSRAMTGMATVLVRNTVYVVFNVMVLCFTLFFFLRDGPFLIRRLVELVPMAPDHKEAIVRRLQVTLYAVIRGMLVVAAVQGALAGVGFALFRVPFPVLLGVATTILAPVPIIGTAGVWIPVAIGLMATGESEKALYVVAWSVLVVGLIDNLLRPILISKDAKLPIILLFFGMLGGLKVYGFMGLLLGPIIIALLLAFIEIYRQEYRYLTGA